MKSIKIDIGEKVSFQGNPYKITRLIDLATVLLKSPTGQLTRANINELTPVVSHSKAKNDIVNLNEQEWETAQRRFAVIRHILSDTNNQSLEKIKEIAEQNETSVATIYRWMERYKNSGLVSSLAPIKKTGGKGKSRLIPEVEAIIEAIINDQYLTKQRKSITKIINEVIGQCRTAGLPFPHPNTVRNRIESIPEYVLMKGRQGKKEADLKFLPFKGQFPGADFPLAVAQMDHTKTDIILVDDFKRKALGRPYLTICIDVYSRMILSYYISFDAPGAIATGICLSTAILPKEDILTKFEVNGEWPCWGAMKKIHLDNAKEFRGSMILRSCKEYGIDIDWRPIATPHMGGHVERAIKTILKAIHNLPGTTFSNIQERKGYNSEKKAVMTLFEFEKWLVNYIVNIYNRGVHKGIGTSPYEKWKNGILGNDEVSGIGIPTRFTNKEKVKLDFLPFFERTVLQYGVLIDHIFYYHDILKNYINSTEKVQGKKREKKKFIFRRDPRDISKIYFYDPNLNEYFTIPYRDMSKPPMSIWEHRDAIKLLKQKGAENIDEGAIFSAHSILNKIVEDSKRNTIKANRRKVRKNESVSKTVTLNPETNVLQKINSSRIDFQPISNDLKPFDELEYGSFK